ncbi:MAG: PAS domain S-box protein [Candidatus Aminicenantes bacterium]|nr:PAS domain S-box protein [Candidatus Aminicenantes bacterium]
MSENKSAETSKRRKILLVEDESLIAMMESELLQSGGYEVLVAHSGEKALEIFAQDRSIDLVLMDIDLGRGIDGAETARRMQALRDVPVVFISSHTEPEILAKTEAITSYGYIVKGSNETAIFASLNMAFRLHAAHQELLKKTRELENLASNLSDAVKKLMEAQKELLAREKKLKETTEHLEATLNSLPDLLFEFDEQGNYLDIRAPNPSLLLRPKEELLGHNISEFLPEEVNAVWMAALQEAAEKGIAEVNYSLELSSGTHYFEATVARKGTNRPGRNVFIALARDITDRIEAQLAQQETEVRFQRLFQAMAEGVAIHRFIFDKHKRPVDYLIVDVNSAFTKHTGIPAEKARGKKASELYGTGEAPYLKEYSEALNTGSPISFESYFSPLQKYLRITAFGIGENLLATVFEDITDRKKDEIALKEREERYRLIFQNTPLGILQFNEQGIITDCNDAFVRAIGSSREALIGFNMLERVQDEKVIKAVQEALAGRIGYYEGVYHSVTADKATPARGFFAGVFDQNGKFISGIGTFEDYTERYRTEEALRQSEALLEATFESSVHSFIFLDTEGRVQKFNQIANRRMIDILGVELKKGEKLVDLLPEKFKVTFPSSLQKALEGQVVHVERKIHLQNGQTWVWYDFYLTPVYSTEKELLGVFIQAEDITENKAVEESLKQSEERFRLIFERSGVVMFFLDPETGQIIDANYRAAEFYGYSREQLKKMNIKEINTLPPEEIHKRMAEARDKKANFFIFPHRLASGEIKEVEVYSYPIQFGNKRFLLSVILDVTDRLKAERQLKYALEEKQAILRELQHRVKNTFALITSYINLELSQLQEKEKRWPLEVLKHRLLTISHIYDLLIPSERYQEINLERFIKDITSSMVSALSSGKTTITLNLELQPLNLDVKRAIPLGLIITEILTNALKHAFVGREEGHIILKLEKTEQELKLQIADDGIGMTAEEAVGSCNTLGTEIIRALAAQIGVQLELNSKPDEGTKYILRLPLIGNSVN